MQITLALSSRHLKSRILMLLAGIMVTLAFSGCKSNVQNAGPSATPKQALGNEQAAPSMNIEAQLNQMRAELKKDPNNAENHYNMSVFLGGANQTDEAIKEAKTALSLAPHEPHYYYNLGQLQEQIRQTPEALKNYIKAEELAISGSSKEYAPLYSMSVARLYESLGQKEKAITWYEKVITQLAQYKDEWNTTRMDRLSTTGNLGTQLKDTAQKHITELRNSK